MKRVYRLLLIIVGGLLLLCTAAAGVSALINRGLPSHSEVVDRLSDLEKARLAETMRLRLELGDQVWPGWGKAEIPTILYNEEYAFLVEYANPAPGWVDVPDGERHGGPWEQVSDDTFYGQVYYRQRLPGPDEGPQAFTVHVGGRWVASMATKEWMEIGLVAKMQEELPSPLAAVFPYKVVVEEFNSDWHISAVSHESFHAYQGLASGGRLEHAESRLFLEAQYPWSDPALQNAWQQELDLLAEALQAPDDVRARELSGIFLAHRERRREEHDLDAPLVDYERQREWAEGLAKYAEMGIWRQAATTPGYEPLPALAGDPDFKGYATFEKRWQQEVAQIKRMAGDQGAVRFYYTGMAQATLLDQLLPGWKEQGMEDGVFLEDLLREAVLE